LLITQIIGDKFANNSELIVLLGKNSTDEDREDFIQRLRFYLPDFVDMINIRSKLTMGDILSLRPILLFDAPNKHKWLLTLRSKVFDVDGRRNPRDGWAWVEVVNAYSPYKANTKKAEQRLRSRVEQLKAQSLDKCYIFGTGPSLEKAINSDWSDGYRVVCNTIVRDADLWQHISPHFIVAADAIYHFGYTEFARAFREDLAKRLRETDTLFVYPEFFSTIVAREFSEFESRLIAIPTGQHTNINVDLTDIFELPALGNVLNILLLPLGCTLSTNVFLWGFDGRAPADQLFWSNSSKHTYPDLMDSLKKSHPAFFDYHLVQSKPDDYVKRVHGDELDSDMDIAERGGWKFVMMHRTWTPTLQKRHQKNF
jgi:hypothetical protein